MFVLNPSLKSNLWFNIYFYSVSHTFPVAHAAPVQFIHHTAVHFLLAWVELGVEQTVRAGAGLALVSQVRGEHEEEVVGQDLGASPGVLQESLSCVEEDKY